MATENLRNSASADPQDAILVDLDGTLALRNERSPFDWHRVSEDSANVPIIDVIQALADKGLVIIVVSGRDEVCRGDSTDWLARYLQRPFILLMRRCGDNRRDEEVKREMWDEHIHPHFNITIAFDDRSRCVDLWRSLGVTTLQVADGDF